MDFFAHLIDLVVQIWGTDREMRRRSLFGESEMEKRNGVWVGVFCASLIALIVLLWLWVEL
jgi:hypothetical protein